MQDKKARAMARNSFPTSTNQTPPWRRPAYKRDINAICTTVGTFLLKQGFQAPDKREPIRSALVARMMEHALRDNSEDPKGYCPECHKWHTVEISVPCPRNPKHAPIELKIRNPKDDANSILAACKIIDKLFPNLAAVSGTINVEGTITTVSAELIKVIVQYVPADKRNECFERIDGMLQNLQQTGVNT